MIKAGEVAFVKTTGETVFVVGPGVGDLTGLGTCWAIKRPIAGQNGIQHLYEFFYDAELETLDEQRKRFMSERKDVIEKFTSAVPSDDPQSFLA